MRRRLFVLGAVALPFAGVTLARVPRENKLTPPKSWQVIDRRIVGAETCAVNFNHPLNISSEVPIALRARMNGFWLNEISVIDDKGASKQVAVKRNLPREIIVPLAHLFGGDLDMKSVALHVTCLPLQHKNTGIEVLAWR